MKTKGGKSPGSRKSAPAGQASARAFPIVGVGASAGGLEAFTELLSELPDDTGCGFVLVQHLDPQHDSALTQLLARATSMPVHEVTSTLRVQANHVYIIAPNTRLTIERGVLKLQPRSNSRFALRSIDFFFEALAKDQHERAVGVILSGTATDGTLGLGAIKAAGGLTFAQDRSARYDSMPRSAVSAGCVDMVLPPGHIARELARIAKHPFVAGHMTGTAVVANRNGRSAGANGQVQSPGRGRVAAPRIDRGQDSQAPGPEAGPAGGHRMDGYEKILLLLRNHCGVDFSYYKPATIQRRITRRSVLNQRDTLDNYAKFLRGNTKELDLLYSDALINVTSFFRNPEAFEVLKRRVFPQLLQQRGNEAVRVWVLGCSTGQEAYSLAMAFTESAANTTHARKLQVFATDLNEANLETARHALYPKSLTDDVSPERLRRFFVEEEGGYRVVKSLRDLVVFARHNLISDPPFSRMDLISCRNLMIYLEPSFHKKAIPALHYALKPGGFLLLGASESVGAFTNLFEPVNKKQKIFSRRSAPTPVFHLPVRDDRGFREAYRQMPRASLSPKKARKPPDVVPRGELNAEREADRVTVNHFAPPGVLINADLQILQFRGSTDAFLEPPTGKARFDLLNMARDGLMLPLRKTINRVTRENRTVRTENVLISHNGRTRAINVEVIPLKNLDGRFLVLFESVERPGQAAPANPPSSPEGAARPSHFPTRKAEAGRIAGLERDLAEMGDYLEAIQEQNEAATEELQAANEEGQSANEELQSLNEELETSKEELESTNEELTTVNDEMTNRNAELSRLNSDLTNLQTTANFVIVLLRRDLTIRRFSAQAAKHFNLLATDVGRSIVGIRHNLHLPDLEAIIAGVIDRVRECDREVQATDGRWYSLRVRPYLTVDNKVDGAVLTLVDIDDLKKTERIMSEAHEHAAAVIRTVSDPLVILSSRLHVLSANEAFYRTFKLKPTATVGQPFLEVDRGSWKNSRLRKLLEQVVPHKSFFSDFEVTQDFPRIGRRCLLLNGRPLNEPGSNSKTILLGIHDITTRRRVEDALVIAQRQLAAHAEHLEEMVARRTTQLLGANKRLESAGRSAEKGRTQYRQLFLESQVTQVKLRQVTRMVLTTQEEERKRISRELHDEVVQTLVGINVELAALGKGSSVNASQLRAKIARIQRLVETSVNAVHRFARELRPAVLDDLGLIPALHAFSRSLAAREHFKVRLTAFGGVETLVTESQVVLFRVAQEALTNVARHANASQVKLTLSKIPGAVRLTISDNGTSFDVGNILQAKSSKRLGLVGMKERVEMVGGTMSIESVPNKGTTVLVQIPFKKEKTIK